MTNRETNREGLTWPEWWRASRLTPTLIGRDPSRYLAAWRSGEDPAEYAAEALGDFVGPPRAGELEEDDERENCCDVCRDAGCRACLPDAKGWVF